MSFMWLVFVLLVSPAILQNNTSAGSGQSADPPNNPSSGNQPPQTPGTKQNQSKNPELQLNKGYPQNLTDSNGLKGEYLFKIDDSSHIQIERWFFFVEVEPQTNQEWDSTTIELSVLSILNPETQARVLKTCESDKGINSCFLTNKNFNYTKEQVQAKVTCKVECKFNISGQISVSYILTPGETLKLDFEGTAYSKVFELDTTGKTFDQLRIILKPETFLNFPAPIGLYMNFGKEIPTKENYDMKGLTIWDDGLGIFLAQPEASGIFTFLIEGPEKNILILENKLVQLKKSNILIQQKPHFDYLAGDGEKIYTATVDHTKSNCLKISILSGAVKLEGIYDTKMKKINSTFVPLSRAYGELEYRLIPDYFKKNFPEQTVKYLNFKIKAIKTSTFVLSSYILTDGITALTPELNKYVQIKAGKVDQYYIELVEPDTSLFERAMFEIIMTTLEHAKFRFRFFVCLQDDPNNCMLTEKEIQSGQQSFPSKSMKQTTDYHLADEIAGVYGFSFQITKNMFRKVENLAYKYIVTMLVFNIDAHEEIYTLQNIYLGRNIYLKEGQTRKDRVEIGQSKYYMFAVSEQNVKDIEVRVHFVTISGKVSVLGYEKDPRVYILEGQEITQFHNTVVFNALKVNEPIYVQVRGVENSLYSISAQVWKKSQEDWSSSKTGYNQIVLKDDIDYNFVINAQSRQAFQIHTQGIEEFILKMSSQLPVSICMTEFEVKPPYKPNCDVIEEISRDVTERVVLQHGYTAIIGVVNNNTRSTVFEIHYSTKDDSCQPRLLGKVHTLLVEQKHKTNCLMFFLGEYQDMQVVVELVNNDYHTSQIEVNVNGVQTIEMTSPLHKISKEELKKSCRVDNICIMRVNVTIAKASQVRVLVQYLKETVTLVDGIAHPFHGVTKGHRNFIYELVNKVNTTVMLQNRKGYYSFFGKIVDQKTLISKPEYPTPGDYMFKSTNPFFFSYHIYVLGQSEIKKAKCQNCTLLISVYQDQEYGTSENGKFSIECTQQDRFLKENEPMVGYLQKNSAAFYQFYNSQNNTVLVTVNTQHRECANLYIKKGSGVRATASDNDKFSETHSLWLEETEIGFYSLTLTARVDCDYTVQFTTAGHKLLSRLAAGIFKDVRLPSNGVSRFLYEHNSLDSIKLLAMKSSGQFVAKAKVFPNLETLLKTDFEGVSYDWSNTDFLFINNSHKLFCSNCTYLFETSSQRPAVFSLMIPRNKGDFPITMDTVIKDELQKYQKEFYRIYTAKLAQFELHVLHGSVKMKVTSSRSNQITFQQAFNETEKPEYISFKSEQGKTDAHDFMFFSKVQVLAMDYSVYTYSLISDKDVQKRGNRIKLGIPESMSVSSNQQVCLSGVLDDPNEQFLLSFNTDNDVKVVPNITIKIRNLFVPFFVNNSKNEMLVTINKTIANLPATYEFCVVSSIGLYLTFIQSSRVIFFPQLTNVVVIDQLNMTFHAAGKILMEINECRSRAVTSISSNFNTMSQMSSEISQVRKSNNIVQFIAYGPVFVHAVAKSATIRWRVKEQFENTGVGYDYYSAGKLRVVKYQQDLTINISPLRQFSEKGTPLKLLQLTYTAYAAQEQMQLYDAMNCNQGTYLNKTMSVPSQKFNELNHLTFQIDKLLDLFDRQVYFLVGLQAEAVFKNSKGVEQDYRFTYSYQQVEVGLLKGEAIIDNRRDHHSFGYIFYIALALIICIIGFLFYRRFLRGYLRRRRDRLADQTSGSVKYQEFISYT